MLLSNWKNIFYALLNLHASRSSIGNLSTNSSGLAPLLFAAILSNTLVSRSVPTTVVRASRFSPGGQLYRIDHSGEFHGSGYIPRIPNVRKEFEIKYSVEL